MAKSVGMLWKLRKFLQKKTLISLYHAFVHSQLLYGIVTCNNSIRAIVGMKKSQHITSFYRDLEITFNNYFLTSAAVHNYYTRSYHSLKYYIPKYRLVRLQKLYKYTGEKYGITLK